MSAKSKSPNVIKEVEKLTNDLLDKLKIKGEVVVKKSEDDHISVNIKTEETGLLIGHHGETLNSLQLILGIFLYKKLGKWVRLVLDVGDYRQAREESLREMVGRIIKEVEEAGSPVTLPYLSPFERRLVHMM